MPLYNLMEDAATAEISRAQVWQWLSQGVAIDGLDGPLTAERYAAIVDEEMTRIYAELGVVRFSSGKFPDARALFDRLCTSPTYEEFLTLPAYAQIL